MTEALTDDFYETAKSIRLKIAALNKSSKQRRRFPEELKETIVSFVNNARNCTKNKALRQIGIHYPNYYIWNACLSKKIPVEPVILSKHTVESLKEEIEKTKTICSNGKNLYPTHIKNAIIRYVNSQKLKGILNPEAMRSLGLRVDRYYAWKAQQKKQGIITADPIPNMPKQNIPQTTERTVSATIDGNKIQFSGETLIIKGKMAKTLFSKFMQPFTD